MSSPSTSSQDLLLAAFNALTDDEQDQALERLAEGRADRRANADSEFERYLGSLQRAADHLGETPNSSSYKRAEKELRELGTPVDNIASVIRHFGSWRMAREAFELATLGTTRGVEERLAKRRLGKVWRYTEKTLREVMARCVADVGHVPLVAEFDHWRDHQIALAEKRGDDASHLPSTGPYRRRWGSFEKALLHLGYTPDQVAERLEQL